jgi:hypothetical protein
MLETIFDNVENVPYNSSEETKVYNKNLIIELTLSKIHPFIYISHH